MTLFLSFIVTHISTPRWKRGISGSWPTCAGRASGWPFQILARKGSNGWTCHLTGSSIFPRRPMRTSVRFDLTRGERALRERYCLTRPFVMYTGGIDHRKNIEGLISAYARLPPASPEDTSISHCLFRPGTKHRCFEKICRKPRVLPKTNWL